MDQSGMGGPTSSFATASIAPWLIRPHKPHYHHQGLAIPRWGIVYWLLYILWTDSGPPTTGLQNPVSAHRVLAVSFPGSIVSIVLHQMSNFETNRFSRQIIVCVHEWVVVVPRIVDVLGLNVRRDFLSGTQWPLRQSSQRRRHLKIGHDRFVSYPYRFVFTFTAYGLFSRVYILEVRMSLINPRIIQLSNWRF